MTALDFSHEGMTPPALSDAYAPRDERNPWLARRRLTWGSSEIAPLLQAYGLAPLGAKIPGWVAEQGDEYQRLGVPRIVAWKAGLRARPKSDEVSKEAGARLERRVLERWRYTEAHRYVDPRTVEHASRLPQSWLPFLDRSCPALAVTPDAWASDYQRRHVCVEVKCSRDPMTEPPWGYVHQTQSQMDAMGAERGFLVVGERWLREKDPEADKRIVTFVIERDAEATRLRYAVATEALRVVRKLELAAEAANREDVTARERKEIGQHVRDTWRASLESMSDRRDAAIVQLEGALAGLDLAGLDDWSM